MPYSQTREFRFSTPWIAISCLLVGSLLNWVSHVVASRLSEAELIPAVAAQSVYSVMFITFFLVLPYISTNPQSTEKLQISSHISATTLLVATALGLVASNIRLQNNEAKILVAIEVFVFSICAVITMIRVFVLSVEGRSFVASALLLGPSISHLFCTALSIQKLQSYMFVLVVLQASLLVGFSLPFKSTLKKYTYVRTGRLKRDISEINLGFYFLLLAGTVIPIGLSRTEQNLLVEALNHARLPLYGSMLFSVLMIPQILSSGTSALHKLARRRNFVFISNSISLITGLFVFVSYLFVANNSTGDHTLDLLSIITSLSLALLMPWLVFRILDKEIDFPAAIASSIILIAYVSGWLNSAVRWPLVGSVAFALLVGLAIARHLFESQQLLGLKQKPLIVTETKSRESLISVVIPSYNPGSSIVTTLENLNSAMAENFSRFEIIVVTDGSTDESPQLIEALPFHVNHIWMKINRGKGSALREGFSRTRGEVVCFIDADGDLDVQSLPPMAKTLIDKDLDIVYGSKLHSQSVVEMSPLRRIVSFCFRMFVRGLFHIDISDTQTGIKVFDGSLVRAITPYCRESGFNLDLELFVLAKEFGGSSYESHPVRLRRVGGTTVGISTLVSMLMSIMKLFIRVNLSLDYTADLANLEGTK